MARPRFHALPPSPFAALAYRRWGPGAALGLTAGRALRRPRPPRRLRLGPLARAAHRVLRPPPRLGAGRRRGRPSPSGSAAGRPAAAISTPRLNSRPGEATLAAGRPGEPQAHRPGAREGVLLGLVAGLVLHLVQDVIANRPRHPGVYAILYRLRHGFDRDRIGWEDHQSFHDWSGKPWYTWV